MTETSPTTDQPELLPCPFCGGKAQLMGFHAPEFWVSCLKIGCKAGIEAFGSKDRAIAAWNTRLTSTTPTFGDMVMAPREPTEAMLEAGGPFAGVPGWARSCWSAMLSAAPASPIPTATEDMGQPRLALEAIKAVTATTKDAVAGLSRIMAITRSAGVEASYSDLMAKPDVALIVTSPRTEWRHLFEHADACTIPPEGWTCSRALGHDGPCAASPIPISVNGAGEREAEARNVYLLQGDNQRMAEALRSCRDQFAFYAREHEAAGKTEKAATNARFAKIATDALEAVKPHISPALDNTAVEGLQAEITRLRGLLVDAGDPAWENARAILVAELMKAGAGDEAVAIEQAQPANVPSWIALNLIALASRAALTAETEKA